MLFTVIWAIGFIITMLLTLPFLCAYYIVKFTFGYHIADKYIFWCTKIWGQLIVLSTGSKVNVTGAENLNRIDNVCFICNHQSMFDIPVLLGWVSRQSGFVAKQELKKVPVLNGWIKAIHSVFIDRSNPKTAVKSIKQASESIRRGHAIVIFPEGTRSIDGLIKEFKPGSLKLATNAKAVIQPITLSGTRLVFEFKKRITASAINLIIHKPITSEDIFYNDKIAILHEVHRIISTPLDLL